MSGDPLFWGALADIASRGTRCGMHGLPLVAGHCSACDALTIVGRDAGVAQDQLGAAAMLGRVHGRTGQPRRWDPDDDTPEALGYTAAYEAEARRRQP